MNTYLALVSGGPTMPRWEYRFTEITDAGAIKWVVGVVERGDIPPMANKVTLWEVTNGTDCRAREVARITPQLTAVVVAGSVRKVTGTAEVQS